MENFDALSLVIISLGAFLLPLLAEKINIPSIVLEIAYGILVGPVLGIVKISEFISGLAIFGFMLLMFLSGFEIELDKFREKGLRTLSVPLSIYILTVATSFYLIITLDYPIFLALVLCTTSVDIVITVLRSDDTIKTNYGQIYPIRKKTASEVTKALEHGWIKHLGSPKYLYSDMGLEFTGEVKTLCLKYGITQYTTFPHSHQGNRAELLVKAFKNNTRKLVHDLANGEQKAEWDTLFFFFGVILSVGGLGFIGYLSLMSEILYEGMGPTIANAIVGVLSAIVDNIPVMFAVITMRPEMSIDQWLLVTLTTGVGGSLLSIGSAAGVALMGQARGYYTFFGHLKWTPVIFLGYIASIYAHVVMSGLPW